MQQPDDPMQETDAPRERLSRLSEASLRINASLDVDTTLRAVMDGARSLTQAPMSLITTVDASGRVEDHLVAGLDADEAEQLWQTPGGGRSSTT